MAREGDKHNLKSMVEEKEDFEAADVCNHPEFVKINMSDLKDQKKNKFHNSSKLQAKR